MGSNFSTFDQERKGDPALGLGVRCALRLVEAWLATCRVKELNGGFFWENMEAGRPLVLALWHHALIYSLYHFRRVRCAIMVSASKDGEMVASALKRWGQIPVRGSSNRHGVRALRQMARLMTEHGYPGGIVADGSRGPALKAQPGAVFLAREAGCPIVPIGLHVRPAYRFDSWDRTVLPLPFSRVWIAFGDPLWIEGDLRGGGLERAVKRLENGLNSATNAARAASKGV